MMFDNLDTSQNIRQWYGYMSVKPTGSHERPCNNVDGTNQSKSRCDLRVKTLREVGSCNNNNTMALSEPVHFNEQLIESLLHVLLIP